GGERGSHGTLPSAVGSGERSSHGTFPSAVGQSAATAAALTLLAAALLVYWIDSGWATGRLGRVFKVASTAAVDSGRKSWALDSLRMLRDHPVLGVGLGNFETAYPAYQSLPSDLWIDHAHDDYVEAVAETGLVGAALILSALALFVAGVRFQVLGARHQVPGVRFQVSGVRCEVLGAGVGSHN